MNEALVVLVRGSIAFFTLIIFARVLGKQQISQLTFFDYVLGISIGSTAASLTTDLTSRAWPHWVGLVTWTVLVYAAQFITLKWRYASKYVDGEPVVVVMEGSIMENAMKKMRYRIADLQEQLRSAGVFDINQVQYAVLETNGTLSVLKKSIHQPVTPGDLKLPLQNQSMASELIFDGIIVDRNLQERGLSREWLQSELEQRGIYSSSDVFLATVDNFGTIYIDTYQDHIYKPINISDYPGPY